MHGINSEVGAAGEEEWQKTSSGELTLAEAIDFLRACHRTAPFLFFNGNTFSSIGRELAVVLFSDLPAVRKREIGSAVAHYVAGVLDREVMVEIIESLTQTAELQVGDYVKTLKGSQSGVIIRILDDGRVKWRTRSGTELIALPESLLKDDRSGG